MFCCLLLRYHALLIQHRSRCYVDALLMPHAHADAEGLVLGWRLQRGWAQRLQRGPAVLPPSKMVVVPAAPALRAMHQAPAGHVSLGYSLRFEGSGRLRLQHHDVLVHIDLDHA